MKYDIVLLMLPGENCCSVRNALTYSGMNVSQIENAEIAKAGLVSYSPAFILIDLGIKNANLLLDELLRSFFRPCPFVIVSADFLSGAERAEMLSRGADACIDYPVNPNEVLAVIRAVRRRERRIAGLDLGRLLPRIEYKDLEIDPLRRTVIKAGEQLLLTPKEFDVLYALAHHTGTVLTKEKIYQSVWGEDYRFASSNVAKSISSLRQKIGLDADGKAYVQTVFGVGYRFGNVE